MADTDEDPGEIELLEDLISRHIEGVLQTFVTCLPGTVATVDLERGVMSVKPVGARRDRNPDTGEEVLRRYAVVPEVRIAYPAVSGGGLTYDVAPGDEVILHVTSTSLDEWAAGSSDAPRDRRRNVLTDAIGYPGARSGLRHALGATVLHGDDVRAGGPDVPPKSQVARQLDLEVLADAIQTAADGIGFGSALKALLTSAGWPSCASVLRTK